MIDQKSGKYLTRQCSDKFKVCWYIQWQVIYKRTIESDGERIVKSDRHLAQLWEREMWHFFELLRQTALFFLLHPILMKHKAFSVTCSVNSDAARFFGQLQRTGRGTFSLLRNMTDLTMTRHFARPHIRPDLPQNNIACQYRQEEVPFTWRHFKWHSSHTVQVKW